MEQFSGFEGYVGILLMLMEGQTMEQKRLRVFATIATILFVQILPGPTEFRGLLTAQGPFAFFSGQGKEGASAA